MPSSYKWYADRDGDRNCYIGGFHRNDYTIIWHVSPCSSERTGRVRESYCLHLQVQPATYFCSFLSWFTFDPEDGVRISFETLGCLRTTSHYNPEDVTNRRHLQRLSLLACSVFKHEASMSKKKKGKNYPCNRPWRAIRL
jgi:hypothetical protein